MAKEKIMLSDVDEILGGGPDEHERVALCRYQRHEGIIDIDGNVIVPFRYAAINGFIWDESGRLAVVNDDNLLGHVDINGNEVVPCRYPFAMVCEPLCFSEDRFPVCNEAGLIGFIDPWGTLVLPYQFHRVRSFHAGLCAVMDAKKKWGYIDRDGNLKIPYRFADAYNFNDRGEATVFEKVLFFTRSRTIKAADSVTAK